MIFKKLSNLRFKGGDFLIRYKTFRKKIKGLKMSLIQSDEYARRLAKAVKLKGGEDWFKDYVEHFKKRTPLKEVEDLSEYFVN